MLRIELDRHGRKGKAATLITDFQGEDSELERIQKSLQKSLGTGGSRCWNSADPYDGQILLQGDVRLKAKAWLEKEGYKVRVL